MSVLPVSILTGQLRNHPSEGDVLTAAYLIEQQAEQNAALRKVIEDAPHEKHCAWLRLEPGIPEHAWGCTCWKSKALAGGSDD